MLEATGDEFVLWGDGSPTASSSTSTTAPRARARRRALRRRRAGQPRHGRRDVDPRAGRDDRRPDRLRRARSSGTRRCRTASRAGSSTHPAPSSSSASGATRRCATALHARSLVPREQPRACASLNLRGALSLASDSSRCVPSRCSRHSPQSSSATVAWLAFRTPHNGWVWHSGGDATEYWTAQWSVAHGFVPQAVISYGLPVFYGWVPLVTGTRFCTACRLSCSSASGSRAAGAHLPLGGRRPALRAAYARSRRPSGRSGRC